MGPTGPDGLTVRVAEDYRVKQIRNKTPGGRIADVSANDRNGLETLVIGLDAACESVLGPLRRDGTIPNLAGLFESGVSAPLDSQLPPWTPSAWPTLFTGVNPGKHGVFDFLRFDGYDWDVVDRHDVREHSCWELLDQHGHTSVVVNVPVTHPAPGVDGAVIPGYTAPAEPTCHPPGILADLREALGEYHVSGPVDEPPDREARLERYRRLARSRGAAFRYLADRFDPEFGFLQFQQTDHVFHECPGDEGAVRAVYQAVDRAIGTVLEACDPDVTVIVSDHGMGEYHGYEFRVNEFLREHGYVETRRGGGMPSWVTAADPSGEATGDGRTGRGLPASVAEGISRGGRAALTRAVRASAAAGLTSQRLGWLLRRLGLADTVLEHVPTEAVREGTERVDFAASTAYMRSRTELGVRLNLAGREPDGVVPPADYDEVRQGLIDLFREVETPDGELLFDAVHPREAVYHGPYLEAAPDVVLVPAGFDHHLTASLRGSTFADTGPLWDHRFQGTIAFHGDGIDTTADLSGAELLDVAPTVLATLGVPRSDRMDGHVLPVTEPAGVERYPPFHAAQPQSPEERAGEGVERQLADLGYLE